jgi:hypothetical protein
MTLARWLLLGCLLGAMALASGAEASEDPLRWEPSVRRGYVDTTYGRIDGDLTVVAGAGATFGPDSPRGTLDLRLRYLDTAGVFLSYEEGFGAASAEPERVIAAGFELRPLFLGRWLTGRELGLDRLDLLVDSLGLEIGVFLEQPPVGAFVDRPGLQLGAGLEVPILPRASGPWIGLHAGVRWSDAALQGVPVMDPLDRALFLSLTVAYHQVVAAHLVDVRDAAPR